MGFASWLHYCSDVAQQKPTKLCTMFGHLLCWYTIYTFSGALALVRPSRWALAHILVCHGVMVTVYQILNACLYPFQRTKNIKNLSPFCSKVSHFLAQLDHIWLVTELDSDMPVNSSTNFGKYLRKPAELRRPDNLCGCLPLPYRVPIKHVSIQKVVQNWQLWKNNPQI